MRQSSCISLTMKQERLRSKKLCSLHFYGMRSELYGKAMSFATVLLQFEFHMPKSMMQKTGVQDQQKEETNTPRPLKDLEKVPAYLKILQDKKN